MSKKQNTTNSTGKKVGITVMRHKRGEGTASYAFETKSGAFLYSSWVRNKK